jgi:hypothetical protein
MEFNMLFNEGGYIVETVVIVILFIILNRVLSIIGSLNEVLSF